jgi:tetratricopeptide (TPR) repeat protein
VLAVPSKLVDKSLLEARPAEAGGMRYRMLETVRAYGQERLVEAGEPDIVRRVHAEHFCALAEQAEPQLRTPDQLRWLERLAAEHDNLLAALRWAVDAGQGNLAVRLVAALQSYWNLRGNRSENRTWLPLVLALPGDAPPEAMGVARATEVGLGLERGDRERANQALADARALFEASGRPPHPMFLTIEVWSALIQGHPEDATAAITRRLDDPDLDPWSRAMAEMMNGQMHLLAMARDVAVDSYERALARFRELGDRWGIAQALSVYSEVVEYEGDTRRAEAMLEEALELARLLGSRMDAPMLLVRLGAVRGQAGDAEGSARSFEEAMRLAREVGANEVLAQAYYFMALLARHDGDLATSHRLLDEARATPSDPTAPFPMGSVIDVALGFVLEMEGRLGDAVVAHRRAIAKLWKMPLVPTWIGVLLAGPALGLAAVALGAGKPERAAVLIGASMARRYPVIIGPLERRDVDRIDELVREGNDDPARFEELVEQGKAMSNEELLAYIDETPWPPPGQEGAEGRG